MKTFFPIAYVPFHFEETPRNPFVYESLQTEQDYLRAKGEGGNFTSERMTK